MQIRSSNDAWQHIRRVVPHLRGSHHKHGTNIPRVPVPLQALHLGVPSISDVTIPRPEMERGKVLEVDKIGFRGGGRCDLGLQELDRRARGGFDLGTGQGGDGVVPVEVVARGNAGSDFDHAGEAGSVVGRVGAGVGVGDPGLEVGVVDDATVEVFSRDLGQDGLFFRVEAEAVGLVGGVGERDDELFGADEFLDCGGVGDELDAGLGSWAPVGGHDGGLEEDVGLDFGQGVAEDLGVVTVGGVDAGTLELGRFDVVAVVEDGEGGGLQWVTRSRWPGKTPFGRVLRETDLFGEVGKVE